MEGAWNQGGLSTGAGTTNVPGTRTPRGSEFTPLQSGAEGLLTVQDVADRCGLSEKAIYRAIERGELGASKLCSRLRIRPEEVDAWIERSSIQHSVLPLGSTEPRRVRFAASNGLRSLVDAKAQGQR